MRERNEWERGRRKRECVRKEGESWRRFVNESERLSVWGNERNRECERDKERERGSV